MKWQNSESDKPVQNCDMTSFQIQTGGMHTYPNRASSFYLIFECSTGWTKKKLRVLVVKTRFLSVFLFPDSHWDFVREILNLTLRVLKPEGKFYAQVTMLREAYHVINVGKCQNSFSIHFHPRYSEPWWLCRVFCKVRPFSCDLVILLVLPNHSWLGVNVRVTSLWKCNPDLRNKSCYLNWFNFTIY